ncbi:hypothetical protein [Pueribacillus sp. YX66]|uniref:hypothetical protein n=1 Tax=Pueribacillus sp. YX66 TaxID=3229242 RepID=UPI00358D9751
MNKAIKLGLLVFGATAITAAYALNQRKRNRVNLSKQRLAELAQPSNEQEDKMVYEGAQTTIQYINRLRDENQF